MMTAPDDAAIEKHLYLCVYMFLKQRYLSKADSCHLIFSISLLKTVRRTFMAPMGQNSWQQKQRMHLE